ncbi:MAG: hypothetical protein K6C10_03345 [Prevotella sp.]|nr:hypothetical protein [Prevotella sp.]
MKLRVINLNQWDRTKVVRAFFMLGMAIAFLGSLNPWFMWPVGDKFAILSSACFIFSICVANLLDERYYSRSEFLAPILVFTILSFYQIAIRGRNVNAYIVNVFYVITFYFIFRAKLEEVKKFCDMLAKAMGGFLAVSMFFFLLFLIGFPLPSRDASFMDLYTYTNYYFFLLDDRSLFAIIPRFQSVFVEPGHMGTMIVMVLFTQIGKWKRWYNISMMIAMLISFSLAAYGLFVGIVFLSLWIRRKRFIRKAILAIGVFAVITIGSFYYNNGDNLLHDLIILRLEIDDGEMVGDNRVTDSFKADYENLLNSPDILTGRDRNMEEFGNSGYRVFIYDYGLIGVFLVILFYLVSMYDPKNQRAVIAVFVIATLNFIIRGFPLWFSNFIPLYCISHVAFDLKKKVEEKEEEQPYPIND